MYGDMEAPNSTHQRKTFVREGGLILSSSCGLFDRKFLHTLKETYTMVDNLKDF